MKTQYALIRTVTYWWRFAGDRWIPDICVSRELTFFCSRFVVLTWLIFYRRLTVVVEFEPGAISLHCRDFWFPSLSSLLTFPWVKVWNPASCHIYPYICFDSEWHQSIYCLLLAWALLLLEWRSSLSPLHVSDLFIFMATVCIQFGSCFILYFFRTVFC